MAKVSLRGIKKTYPGGVTAVSDFNLDIEDKEFIVIVGPSGCGKSTTLRMVAGLEDITEGELFIDGTFCNNIEPKDRDIAMVFQNYALYPHMTVFENMAFSLKMRRVPKNEIRRRVQEVAQTLEIEHLAERKPKELSGGQMQRVALGRAIVREPKVFLMDEPLSNLDAKLRVQMRTELIKLHKRLQRTFIYVTHDQVEAMTMGTRIVVMRGGFIQQVDSPQNLYKNPLNQFVAGFVGTPPMNFFDSTLVKEGGLVFSVFGNNKVRIPDSIVAGIDSGYIGRNVIMGIRPESISDSEMIVSNMPDNVVDAEIDLIEPTGATTNIHFTVGGEEEMKIAVVDSRSAAHHRNKTKLAFDMSRTYFFDVETEKIVSNYLCSPLLSIFSPSQY